jgi:hypothetical protein
MKDDSIQDDFYVDLQKDIDKTDRKADLYTVLFYIIRVSLILLAGTITFLSAQEADMNGKTILGLGIVTTFLTAADTLFQIDGKKNTYKIMLYDFRMLRSEYVYNYRLKKITPELLNEYFLKYKAIRAMGRDLLGSDTK